MKFNPWRLPKTMEVGGESYEIRTDFRDILTILTAFGDPELDDYAKQIIMLKIIYPNWKNIPEENLPEAAAKAASFIDCGQKDDGKQSKRLVDWEKDAPILIPSINSVAGEEIRAKEYLHWWTFLGYYMEIREGLFAQVVTIRQKKANVLYNSEGHPETGVFFNCAGAKIEEIWSSSMIMERAPPMRSQTKNYKQKRRLL